MNRPNIVCVGNTYYNLEDPCINCGHAFECNSTGSTKVGVYPTISTQFKRYCIHCSTMQEWTLKKGKQPFLHKIDDDMRGEDNE